MKLPVKQLLSVGSLIDKRYVIDKCLGNGSTGVVFLATDKTLGRHVALKVLLNHSLKNEEDMARFEREVKACARIRSANVIRVFDCGETDEGNFYYTMEYIQGKSLYYLLHENLISKSEVISLLKDIAQGLAAIHDAGLIHRDLTPGNILFINSRAVICDFGLVQDKYATQITKTGSILGTPHYLAPEMVTEGSATIQTDIYQFGAIAYELLTGVKLFDKSNLGELYRAVVAGDVVVILKKQSSLSPEWRSFLSSCLAKTPDDRPRNARQLLEMLAQIPLISRNLIFDSSTGANPPVQSSSSNETVAFASDFNRKYLRVLFIIIFLLLCSFFCYIFYVKAKSGSVSRMTNQFSTKIVSFHLLSAKLEENALKITCKTDLTVPVNIFRVREGVAVKLPSNSSLKDGVLDFSVYGFQADDDDLIFSGAGNREHHLASYLNTMVIDLAVRLNQMAPGKAIFRDKIGVRTGFGGIVSKIFPETKKQRLVEKDKNRQIRSLAILKKIRKGLDSGEFEASYSLGVAISSLVEEWSIVDSSLKQLFFEAMDNGRQLELVAGLESAEFLLNKRSPRSLREPSLIATSAKGREQVVFETEGFTEIGLRTSFLKTSVTEKLVVDFALARLSGSNYIELDFDVKAFKLATFTVKLNDVFAGRLLDRPWVRLQSPGREMRTNLYLNIPSYLFAEGNNKLVIEPELLFGYLLSNSVKIHSIKLRYAPDK